MAVEIIKAIPDLEVDELTAVSIDLDQYFSGATAYAVSGLEVGSGLTVTSNELSGTLNATDFTAPPNQETTVVTITATDDAEGEETATFNLIINKVLVLPTGNIKVISTARASTTATITYAYDGEDGAVEKYTLDGGDTWTSATSPIVLSELDEGVRYTGEVEAKTADGRVVAPFTFQTNKHGSDEELVYTKETFKVYG